MVRYVCLENLSIEAGWKYAEIMFGERFVFHVDFRQTMRMVSVGFLVINHMVSLTQLLGTYLHSFALMQEVQCTAHLLLQPILQCLLISPALQQQEN